MNSSGALAGLRDDPGPGPAAIADLMRDIQQDQAAGRPLLTP
jgi:hypothetical protein